MKNLAKKLYYLFLTVIFQTFSISAIKLYLNLFKDHKSHPYIITGIYFISYLLFIIVFYFSLPKKKKNDLSDSDNIFRKRANSLKLYRRNCIITIEEDKKNKKEKKEIEGLKILLMGKAKVGKTSMRSIIFANKAPEETKQLGFTENVNETHSKFLGKLYLDLYDCGGQEDFVKQYLESRRDKIFSDVGVLIFVVEAENYDNRNDDDHIEDISYFEK